MSRLREVRSNWARTGLIAAMFAEFCIHKALIGFVGESDQRERMEAGARIVQELCQELADLWELDDGND